MLRNVLALGVKELRGLFRDRMMLFLVVYSFTISIYTASRSMPDSLTRAQIAIVDEDHSAVSARIAEGFYPPHFTAPKRIGPAEVDPRMNAGLDTFTLDVPPASKRTSWPGARRGSSWRSTRPGWRRRSPAQATSARS